MQEAINMEEFIGAMNDAYGYDTKLKANTEKDNIAKKNKELIAEMAKKFTITTNPIPNETFTGIQ